MGVHMHTHNPIFSWKKYKSSGWHNENENSFIWLVHLKTKVEKEQEIKHLLRSQWNLIFCEILRENRSKASRFILNNHLNWIFFPVTQVNGSITFNSIWVFAPVHVYSINPHINAHKNWNRLCLAHQRLGFCLIKHRWFGINQMDEKCLLMDSLTFAMREFPRLKLVWSTIMFLIFIIYRRKMLRIIESKHFHRIDGCDAFDPSLQIW